MKYEAIIFDMDGTIIDTNHIWENATNQLILNKGIQLTIEQDKELKNKLRGFATIKSCQIIKDYIGINDSLENLINEKLMIARSLYEKHLTFIDGFIDFHDKAKQQQLKMGIATNADDSTVNIVKRLLKLENFFGEHIYNISHVNNVYKPNPALYLHAAQQLKIDPTKCIAIEDSQPGISAAKKAGMFCIGINTSKDRDQLKESDTIIDYYNEININDLILKK